MWNITKSNERNSLLSCETYLSLPRPPTHSLTTPAKAARGSRSDAHGVHCGARHNDQIPISRIVRSKKKRKKKSMECTKCTKCTNFRVGLNASYTMEVCNPFVISIIILLYYIRLLINIFSLIFLNAM